MNENRTLDPTQNHELVDELTSIIEKAEKHILAIPFDSVSKSAVARLLGEIRAQIRERTPPVRPNDV